MASAALSISAALSRHLEEVKELLSDVQSLLRGNASEHEPLARIGPVLNENLPDRTGIIAAHISEALQYGCEFWMSHASRCSEPSDVLVQSVHELVTKPIVLFWLEVMSMRGLLSQSELMLDECARVFQVYIEFCHVLQLYRTDHLFLGYIIKY